MIYLIYVCGIEYNHQTWEFKQQRQFVDLFTRSGSDLWCWFIGGLHSPNQSHVTSSPVIPCLLAHPSWQVGLRPKWNEPPPSMVSKSHQIAIHSLQISSNPIRSVDMSLVPIIESNETIPLNPTKTKTLLNPIDSWFQWDISILQSWCPGFQRCQMCRRCRLQLRCPQWSRNVIFTAFQWLRSSH